MNREYDAVIIGGGAAGMFAAGTAGQNGRRVLVLDKNPKPARKVLITGKGRCNVTNACDINDFLSNVRSNPRFLYSALSQLPVQKTMELFEELGVALKVERGNRVFPVSDKSSDIVDALIAFATRGNAEYQNAVAGEILLQDGSVSGVKTQSGEIIFTRSVLVATGGCSYPKTGSDGSGYVLAKQAGHTVTPVKPSLVPLEIEGNECRDMQGLSLKNVTVTLTESQSGKILYHEMGEMLFTHFGMSGPLILSASAHMHAQKAAGFRISIDLKPALSMEKLDARLLRDFEKNTNKEFINSLGELLPRKMIPVIVGRSGIGGQTKVHQIRREQRSALCQVIKNLSFTVKGTRPIEEAIVTSGGVSVSEINPKTMESKLVKGLYFAGEIIDVDAYTGGFNLQIAFSTGYVAGMNL